MSGYVCVIASGKGGVGKTTTAVNLAAAFEQAGYDAVVVDADLGMANLAELLEIDHEHSVHDVLAGEAIVSDAMTDAKGGLRVVPGEASLDAFVEADPAKLRTVIDTLESVFDIVLVDTGSGLSHGTAVPLGRADGVVLVTTPEDVAFEDTAKTAELTDRVGGTVVGGVVTRVSPDTDVEDTDVRFECPLLGVIPEDVEAAGEEPLVTESPDSDAARAYVEVTERLEGVFFEEGSAPTDDDDDRGGPGIAGLSTG